SSDRKRLAQIIDRDDDRIVSSLPIRQNADTGRTGPAHLLVRDAVSIVQERTKQGRRGRYAAAPLSDRKGCLLVTQQLDELALSIVDELLSGRTAYLQAHGQRIDEHSEHPLGTRAALQAPQQHRSEHNVITTTRLG